MTKETMWDLRFMAEAQQKASYSKDRSRQCGCVIVGPDHEPRSSGWNGFPRGVDDNVDARHQRPAKYMWTEHAERNAIYNAARVGIPLLGCTAYIPWYPCADCARALIQSGVKYVVAYEPDFNDAKWGADFRVVEEMLAEAGVQVRFLPGTMGVAR